MILLGVIFLTPDSLFAQSQCAALFAPESRPSQGAPLEPTASAQGIDFVWLLHAPKMSDDKAYREKIARGERVQSPMPGGLRGFGIAEETVTFAHQTLPSVIDSLLTRHRDRFSAEELGWLAQIASVIHFQPQLKFVSGTKHPDVFKTEKGEAARIASTRSAPGSDIFINSDQVLSMTPVHGSTVGVSPALLARYTNKEFPAQMFGILVHELAHQIGLKDDEQRAPDRLAAKVSKIVAESSQFVRIEGHDLGYFGFMRTNLDTPSPTAQSGRLVFYMPEHIFDLTGLISSQLEKTFGKKVTGVWTESLRWEPLGPWDMGEQAQPFASKGEIVFRTEDGALHEVPARLILMISHMPSNPSDGFMNAYRRRRNWSDSPGFVIVGEWERHVGLQVLKEKVRPYTPQLKKAPAEVAAVRVARSISPGDALSGEIELRLADGSVPAEAQVIFGSDDLAFGSLFKPFRFKAAKAELLAATPGSVTLRFEHRLRSETVKRSLHLQKIILRSADGREEVVEPTERVVLEVKGRETRLKMAGIGAGRTEKEIRVSANKVPLEEEIMRLDAKFPRGMTVPLYFDVNSTAPLVRAEILAQIHFRTADGRVKNVNAVIDLLDGKHPWIRGARIEDIPGAGKRVHLSIALPSEFEGRQVVSMSLKQLHVIDQNLAELVDSTHINIHEKPN